MEKNLIDITEFDDEYTIRRKWAFVLDKHFDTLIKLEDVYLNLEEQDGYYARNAEKTFLEMANILTKQYEYLMPLDIVMSYLDYLGIDNLDNEEELLEQFIQFDGNHKYESTTELFNSYRSWRSQRIKYKAENENYVAVINRVHNDLLTIQGQQLPGSSADVSEPLIVESKLVTSSVSYVITPTIENGERVSYTDGIDIFNRSIVSERLPLIKYNDEKQSYYKVFTGDTLINTPNYANIDIPEKESNNINIFYMKLWAGRQGGLEIAAKKDYIDVTYYLKFNKLMLTLSESKKNIDEEATLQALKEAFPMLDLSNIRKVDLKGSFNLFSLASQEKSIYDLDFDYISFLDIVTYGLDLGFSPPDANDIWSYSYLLGTYFHLDEVEKIFARKVATKLHYRSLTSGIRLGNFLRKDVRLASLTKVKFELVNNVTIANESFLVNLEGEEVILDVASNTNYIQINVTAANEEELNLFIKIFKLLFLLYSKIRRPILEDYNTLLGEELVNELFDYQKEYKPKQQLLNEESKTRKLKKLDSDIFVSAYPSICAHPPTYVPEEQLDYWKQKTIKYKTVKPDGTVETVERERQIMKFPKNNPKYHFVCEGDTPADAQYIGLVKNTLSNRDVYPYLPCCHFTDQQIEGKATNYNAYYNDMKLDPRGSKSKNLIKGKFILLTGRYGNIPSELATILSYYSEHESKFLRLGMPRDTNSLIHCICQAISVTEYLDAWEDSASLDEFVWQIRKSLLALLPCMKQELYDRDKEEIEQALLDDSIFLDPALFYRALEELFDVNIFSFVPKAEEANIEIPRCWLFHIPNYRPNRPTILIYKHYGSVKDNSVYPQCELIVQTVSRGHLANFDKRMYDICYRLTLAQTNTITWSVTNQAIKGNTNIYSSIDYNALIEQSANKQFIDKYGKCRAFNFQVSDDDKLYNVTMITPPCQPENLPLIQSETEIHQVDYQIATAIFGRARKFDIQAGLVNGLWFRVFDIEEAIYVPVKPFKVSNLEKVVKGHNNPLFGQQSDMAKRYSELKRTIKLYLELLKWLYEIYKLETNQPDGNVIEFVNNYLIVDDYQGDTLVYYNMSRVPYRLGYYTSVVDALAYLQTVTDNFVAIENDNPSGLIVYNELFYDQLVEYLRRYNRNTEGLAGNPAKYLTGYFQHLKDYNSSNSDIVFITSKAYRDWLERMIYGNNRIFEISSYLDVGKAITSLPYAVRCGDKFYLVQNVLRGELYRAVAVALKWNNDKLNTGYHSQAITDVEYLSCHTTFYTISINRQLMLKEVNLPNPIDETAQQIEILQYSNTIRYAALLPLN